MLLITDAISNKTILSKNITLVFDAYAINFFLDSFLLSVLIKASPIK